jgi:hypothetical protein
MMGNGLVNALIVAGIVFAIGYGWISYLNRGGRRSRAGAGGDGSGDVYTASNDGSSPGSWFAGDTSSGSTDTGSCSSSDGGGGGDCGGGGDGGGD